MTYRNKLRDMVRTNQIKRRKVGVALAITCLSLSTPSVASEWQQVGVGELIQRDTSNYPYIVCTFRYTYKNIYTNATTYEHKVNVYFNLSGSCF